MAILNPDEDLIDYDVDDMEPENISTLPIQMTQMRDTRESASNIAGNVTSIGRDTLDFGLGDDDDGSLDQVHHSGFAEYQDHQIDYDIAEFPDNDVALHITQPDATEDHLPDTERATRYVLSEDEINYDDPREAVGTVESSHSPHQPQLDATGDVVTDPDRAVLLLLSEDEIDYDEVPPINSDSGQDESDKEIDYDDNDGCDDDENSVETSNIQNNGRDIPFVDEEITYDDNDDGRAPVTPTTEPIGLEEALAHSNSNDNEITYDDDEYYERSPSVPADPVPTRDPCRPDIFSESHYRDDDEITYTDDEHEEEECIQPHQRHENIVDESDPTRTESGVYSRDQVPLGPTDINDKDDVSDDVSDDGYAPYESNISGITVVYRGAEFWLYSDRPEDTKTRFFPDQSVIDLPIDSLLAAFRKELSNEMYSDEELVFHVDELGLEYSESTDRECLTSVTLRQHLEMYDQLIKNQDPDAERTLYCFLFTKLHPGKRLETLIEKTYDGRPLDAVAHYIHPPIIEDALTSYAQQRGHDFYPARPRREMERAHRGDGEGEDMAGLGRIPAYLEGDQASAEIKDGETRVNYDSNYPEEPWTRRLISKAQSSDLDGASVDKSVDVSHVNNSDMDPEEDYSNDVSGAKSPSVALVDWDVDLDAVEVVTAIDIVEIHVDESIGYDSKTLSPDRTSMVNDDHEPTGEVSSGLQLHAEQEVMTENDEIDWRDEPEAIPPSSTNFRSPITNISKRLRSNDESFDEREDGQNVKRRRS